MSNSLGGINLAQIAQESLRVLSVRLIALAMFTRDFSMEIREKGESVTTRVATDLDAEDVSAGFTASDATSVPYTITLNLELGKAQAFNQAEISKGGMDLIKRLFIGPIVNAVGKGVIKEVVKLATAANFPNVLTSSYANFDADDVADIATAQNVLNVGDERFGILTPNYYGSLAKDNSIQAVYASGSDAALRDRRVGKLAGYNPIEEFNGFPTSGTTFNENLNGLFGSKESLLIAARFPAMPDNTNVVEVENLVEPVSGFPIQFQMFYVPKERKFYIAVATLFGVKAGPANNLYRIAAP